MHPTYFLILATKEPKGLSQQYILTVRIPVIISFIIFTRSSVNFSVFCL